MSQKLVAEQKSNIPCRRDCAALLVAGCIAARAAADQQSPRMRSRGASAGRGAAGRSSNAHTPHQACGGATSAGSGSYSSAAGWEAAAAAGGGGGNRAGSGGGPPAAAPRGRPSSAPAARGRQGRSPSPTATSPGALGPAAGRIGVYEQRTKLLFELGRAQARAAAQSSSAAQVGDVARLAGEEVARLQGQLADLDRKNRLRVDCAAGSVDSRGHIPGSTPPAPGEPARPWDPPDADLTFSPKISAKSQQLMAESQGQGGSGGFLARLDNDLKRRQVKMKELERRYNTFGSGGVSAADAAAAAKAAAAELSLVLGFLSQRGWADLSVPGSRDGLDAAAQQELDEQLDEVVEAHSRELSLGEVQVHGILAARGHKKVAALAAVVRTQQFMDRYKADLSTRDSRLSELQEKWFKQQLQCSPAATGPTGRLPAAVLTAEQRDMQQALQWFRALGWDVQDLEDACEDLLAALISRACAYKTEVEKLHDKAAAAAAIGAQQAAAVGEPQIDWQSIPWRDDGLNDLMQAVLDAQKAAADSAAAKAAAAGKPSAVDAALRAASSRKPGSPAGSAKGAAAEAGAGAGSAGKHPLDHAVQLLAGMRWAGLDQLTAAAGTAKKLAVYRALRTQQFLEFTAADLAAREAKQRALWAAFEASRRGKVASKAELDNFYARLQDSGWDVQSLGQQHSTLAH
ncbi:hypothetical protein COO60DRAFT_1461752 [Scenedesmus sp. NREL 46B-D3]|nr:hypothetical protein COO60DRAFT_1461752 [Scenedesmus sp. NREL 46B-D3]